VFPNNLYFRGLMASPHESLACEGPFVIRDREGNYD